MKSFSGLAAAALVSAMLAVPASARLIDKEPVAVTVAAPVIQEALTGRYLICLAQQMAATSAGLAREFGPIAGGLIDVATMGGASITHHLNCLPYMI